MAEITITTNEHRARNIAIGFAVLIVLTWWQITGSLPLLAESFIPEPQDGRVSSIQSFFTELAADGLYLVGSFAVAIFSGIWSLVVSLIKMLLGTAQSSQPADVTKLLDERTDAIFKTVEEQLNKLDERIEKLEMVPQTLPTIAPKRRSSASGAKS
jgi:hypothetical protein